MNGTFSVQLQHTEILSGMLNDGENNHSTIQTQRNWRKWTGKVHRKRMGDYRLAITNLLKIYSAQKFIIFVDELLNEPTWAWKMNAKSRDADYENRWYFFLFVSFFFSFTSRFMIHEYCSDIRRRGENNYVSQFN